MNATMTKIAEDVFPEVDLNAGDFFVSMTFREGGKLLKFGDVKNTKVQPLAHIVQYTNSDQQGVQPTISREKLTFKDCNNLDFSTTKFSGNREITFSTNSKCLEFKANENVQGALGESIFKYIEVRLDACDETETTCMTNGLNPGDTLLNPTLKAAHEYFKEVSVQLSFLDALLM